MIDKNISMLNNLKNLKFAVISRINGQIDGAKNIRP